MMWRAKNINFDTACGFDVQALFGAGVEQTLAYLRDHDQETLPLSLRGTFLATLRTWTAGLSGVAGTTTQAKRRCAADHDRAVCANPEHCPPGVRRRHP